MTGPLVLVFLDIYWQGCTPAGRRRVSSVGELAKGSIAYRQVGGYFDAHPYMLSGDASTSHAY